MPGGRPKRKYKQSSNSEISPKLGKSDRRRALDKARHIEKRHGDKGQQGRSEGKSVRVSVSTVLCLLSCVYFTSFGIFYFTLVVDISRHVCSCLFIERALSALKGGGMTRAQLRRLW